MAQTALEIRIMGQQESKGKKEQGRSQKARPSIMHWEHLFHIRLLRLEKALQAGKTEPNFEGSVGFT